MNAQQWIGVVFIAALVLVVVTELLTFGFNWGILRQVRRILRMVEKHGGLTDRAQEKITRAANVIEACPEKISDKAAEKVVDRLTSIGPGDSGPQWKAGDPDRRSPNGGNQ